MKILISADPFIPVPPFQYGGIERIIDGLAHQYQRSGHEVYLLAHHESRCSAVKDLLAWPGKKAGSATDTLQNTAFLFNQAKKYQPDVIHSFSRLLYLYPMLLTGNIPVVQSYQRAVSPKSTRIARNIGGNNLHYTACAFHMVEHLDWKDQWHIISNFTDVQYFTPGDYERTYLAFLGRIEPIKGAAEAVQVALKSGIPLKMAGNIPPEHQDYFDQEVKPHLGKHIEYIGPVNDAQKRILLQGALAMLFPIRWEEPFGIVMAESLACGAPIIAFNRGSVPEVVSHGKDGFICETVEDMVEAVKQINPLHHLDSRTKAETHFSSQVVGMQYEQLFETILGH